MPSEKLIVFDGQSLLELLKHYTSFADETIPIDAEIKEIGTSKFLSRYVCLQVEGNWDAEIHNSVHGMDPLHIRYAGKKVLAWGAKGEPLHWDYEDEVRG